MRINRRGFFMKPTANRPPSTPGPNARSASPGGRRVHRPQPADSEQQAKKNLHTGAGFFASRGPCAVRAGPSWSRLLGSGSASSSGSSGVSGGACSSRSGSSSVCGSSSRSVGGRGSGRCGLSSRSGSSHRSGGRCRLFLLATSSEGSSSDQSSQNDRVLHFGFLVGRVRG